MQKSFLYNIVLLLGLNFIVKPLYVFGIDAQVQNALGEQVYGNYFSLFSFCYLFQVLLDPGLQNYNVTSVSKSHGLIKQQFLPLLFSKLCLSIIFATAIYVAAIFLGYNSEEKSLLLWIIVLQILISFSLSIRTNLSALGKYATDSLLSVVDKSLLILGLGYLFYVLRDASQLNIFNWVQFQSAAAAFSIIIALFFLFPYLKGLQTESLVSNSKKLLKKAFPFALVFLLMSLYTKMDGVMLKQLLTDGGTEAGIYAAGFRLYEASNMFGFLFASLLLPMFAAHLNDKEKIYALSQSALRLMLPFSSILVIACLFYSTEIMSLIYTEGDSYYGQVFQLLMLSFFFVSLTYIYGSLITSTAKLKWFNLSFVIGIALNWSLNYYLIPEYQALGAAFATLCTQAFILIAQIFISHRMMQLSINSKMIAVSILYIASSVAVFAGLKHFMPNLNWFFIMSLSAIFSLLVSFLLGLLRFELASSLFAKRIEQ